MLGFVLGLSGGRRQGLNYPGTNMLPQSTPDLDTETPAVSKTHHQECRPDVDGCLLQTKKKIKKSVILQVIAALWTLLGGTLFTIVLYGVLYMLKGTEP